MLDFADNAAAAKAAAGKAAADAAEAKLAAARATLEAKQAKVDYKRTRADAAAALKQVETDVASALKQAETDAAAKLKQAEVKLEQQPMRNRARQKLKESNHASKLQVMKVTKEQVTLAVVVNCHATCSCCEPHGDALRYCCDCYGAFRYRTILM